MKGFSEDEEDEKTYEYNLHGTTYTVTVSTITYSFGNRKGIQLYELSGQPFITASTNLPDAELGQDEVFIKTWTENEGILEFLIKNGIVSDTGRRQPTGFTEAAVCKLLIE